MSLSQNLGELAHPLAELETSIGVAEKEDQRILDQIRNAENTKNVYSTERQSLETKIGKETEIVGNLERKLALQLRPRCAQVDESLQNLLKLESQTDERVRMKIQALNDIGQDIKQY